MPQVLNPRDNIILSPDLFAARASEGFGSVRALEHIPRNGVYFYEVIIVSPEVMQIGWATKEFFMTDNNDDHHIDGVGDDRFSIGFDASRNAIWHKTKLNDKHEIEVREWQANDIVGCLIDVPNKNFIFYLNGQEFDVRKLNIDVHFSDMPYYPAASFQRDEDTDDSGNYNKASDKNHNNIENHTKFNFGQQPFHYPPQNIEFKDFYGYGFDRYFQSLDSENCGGKIIVSKDGFSARNTSYSISSIETVYASKTVNRQGAYFYEVKMMTDGLMKIGWAVENNPLAIGFDGYRKMIWFNEKQKFSISSSSWKVDDVVGCLIDVSKQVFIFYHNGKKFNVQQLRIGVNFNSRDQYLPAIELASGQQVYCNFGQEPFRFGPRRMESKDLCENRFNS